MKAIQFFIASFLLVNVLSAQDAGLYWKYKDYDGAIAVSVPRWATIVGSAFLDEKEDRKLVRKIHKAKVLFFEDKSPFTRRDISRFERKAKRRHLEELLTVRTGKTYVNIRVKERRGIVRKVVVFVNAEEGAGLVTVKGRFNINDLNRVIQKSEEKGKKKNRELSIPNLPKVPVLRT